MRLIIRACKKLDVFKDWNKIIVPVRTYIAAILSIIDNNLVTILVEPAEKTYNLDFNLIEDFITNKTKGIMVVHLNGRVCWSGTLEEIVKRNNLRIIEHNAQAIDAE